MERFHSISFGLDLGIMCQGMKNAICYHALPYKNNKICPQNLQLDTLKSPFPLRKHSLLTEFFTAAINHIQFSSWIQVGFRSYTQTPPLQLIQCISQWNHVHAWEYKSHDHFSRAYTTWTVLLEGLSNPVSVTHPTKLEACKQITHLKHKKSIKATIRAPTDIQCPR